MNFNFLFVFNSICLGVGLAMDAFSVSLANGMQDHKMKAHRMCGIAGVYAFFQFIMPMIGWVCVHTIVETFQFFEKFIPWIALLLLLYIGGNMILDAIKGGEEKAEFKKLGIGTLLLQGVATSIDALSVGFTIADYNLVMALFCGLMIGFVTFAICMAGLMLGKKFGTKLSNKATLLGGCILILIGIEIFVKGVFF
ncbi:MAG: manganese efflux pump MntP family protein [Lachnospiraceae bacterium]